MLDRAIGAGAHKRVQDQQQLIPAWQNVQSNTPQFTISTTPTMSTYSSASSITSNVGANRV